jgi:hypothetical protein
MMKGTIAKKMEYTQLVLAKVRKVKAKKAKAAGVKSRKASRKRSRKGKKVSKKRKARNPIVIGKLPTPAECRLALAIIEQGIIPIPPLEKEIIRRLCQAHL